MPKPSTLSKSGKIQFGDVRGRDADFPGAPMHVTGDAQAKTIDINTARQSEFSRMERNKLPERPSTSCGPAAQPSMRRNAEKRETKDDLHFNPLGAQGTRTTFYNFPLPGSLSTPNNTPRSSPPIRTPSLPRSDTLVSMEGPSASLNIPQMEIGMALGSPTHQPTNWQSQHVHFESSTRNMTPDSVGSYVDNETHITAPSKQKASKWKIFGGLFGGSKKGQGESPQAFYQLQLEGVVVQTTSESNYVNFGEPSSSDQKYSKARGRGRTNSSRKPDKHKPGMKRAQTAPLDFELSGSNRGRMQTATPEITLDGGPLNPRPGTRHAHGGPLLDVDIPSVEMERYSVMFGSLLQKSTGTPSLLARRQATLDRLKTVNEALAVKEQELEAKSKQLRPRRATSPQPTKSPAFSLFPNNPSRLAVRYVSPSPNHRSPLQRSNTSPAVLSPSRPTFAPGPGNKTHANLMAPGPHVPMMTGAQDNANQQKGEPKLSKQASDAQPKSQSSTRYWSPEESHLTLDSPSSEVEEDIYDPTTYPMKPKLDEPQWQMILPQHGPASSVSGSTSSSSDHSTSTSASSVSMTSIAPFTTSNFKTVKIQAPPKTHSRSATKTSTAILPHRKDSEASVSSSGSVSKTTPLSIRKQSLEQKSETKAQTEEERLKTAADVSIARQISVSRKQRQLLIPIKASSNPNLKSKYNQNFLSPLNTLNINRVASPLGAVAQAASPVDRNGRSSAERKGSKSGAVNERLVASSVKPSTPTLVLVGSGEKEKTWSGKAVESPILTGSGEIRVGLTVGHHGSSGLSPGEIHGHQHRKSETVLVESVSLASN